MLGAGGGGGKGDGGKVSTGEDLFVFPRGLPHEGQGTNTLIHFP